jgi:hypothetical protein
MTARRLALTAAALLGVACAEEPAGPTPGSPEFDGEEALALVRRQVEFGPRVPGSEAHRAQLEWMRARLDSVAPVVLADTFTHVTTSGADTLTLVNVMARFRPDAGRRILLLTHWDTRPTADAETDIALRERPIPGANDGGSGTAVLLVLAELLAGTPPPLGVDLLFVDGEDFGPGVDDMLLGARRYAETVDDEDRPLYGVLLDMVGDADARFPVEGISAQAANPVVQKIWRAAERLGYRQAFPTSVGQDLTDDHVPLIQAGIPTANVIDFTYGPGNAYWHTSEDTPDKLSGATLGMVGAVVTELVYSGG